MSIDEKMFKSLEDSSEQAHIVFQILKHRRSVRAFCEDDIPEDILLQILEAARWAPSARNAQPVEYIIVTDKTKRQHLAKAARQPQPQDAPVCIIVVVDLRISATASEISSKDVSTIERAIMLYAHLDAAAAIENMLLASTVFGLGSLWISGFDESEVKKIIALPKTYKPIAIIVLGIPKKFPPPPIRRKLENIIHKESFQSKQLDDSYLAYGKAINTQDNE